LLNIASPPSDKCLELRTPIRKAIAVEVLVSNSLSELATFEVLIQGEGLMGDEIF